MSKKSLLTSKTLWFNLAGAIIPPVVNTLAGQGVIDPQTQAITLSVGNFLLRFLTTTAII